MEKEIKKEVNSMNLFEKLLNITNELTAVAKNLNVGYGQNSYKAVGEADVLAAVKPLEFKYQVYSYPLSRSIIVDKETTTKSGGTNQFIRIETVYRFVNVNKPEEFIDITTFGDGVDTSDKSPGKAMTYADKYALLTAYKIITGKDPDQHLSEEQKTSKPKQESKKEVEEVKYINKDQSKWLKDNLDPERFKNMLKVYNLTRIEDMELATATAIIAKMKQDNE